MSFLLSSNSSAVNKSWWGGGEHGLWELCCWNGLNMNLKAPIKSLHFHELPLRLNIDVFGGVLYTFKKHIIPKCAPG